MSTIKDAAIAAGVSTATVSRVLNNTGPVSESVRERVERAVAEIGYRPNALARSLRTESTGTIGLIVSNILNPFFTELARAAEDVAIAEGFTMILGNADEIAEKEERYIRELLEKRVDGLLLNPAVAKAPHIKEIVDRGVPVVLIDRSVEGVTAPLVRADGTPAIGELVAHMVALGHRKLGIISGPRELRNGLERYEAFIAASSAIGYPVQPQHIAFGDFERESGAAAMRRLMSAGDPPDAVFVANGRMTLGALEALKSLGIRVGQDVGVASYDDDPFFSLLDPALTAIEQPTAELGRLAMSALLGRIRGGGADELEPLHSRLIIRRSCGETE
ncbi:MAG: LacI family transcriptional regulator [Rhodoglobus sp.]|nr:LacI family transcriptional regulator [Rhodoglobus sp.]